MSAERLREAADRLDALAEAAPGGPWKSWIEGRDHMGGDSIITTSQEDDLYVHVYRDLKASDAAQDYIAAMHPGVGKALAAWLRLEADIITSRGDEYAVDISGDHALAVADAILGRAS